MSSQSPIDNNPHKNPINIERFEALKKEISLPKFQKSKIEILGREIHLMSQFVNLCKNFVRSINESWINAKIKHSYGSDLSRKELKTKIKTISKNYKEFILKYEDITKQFDKILKNAETEPSQSTEIQQLQKEIETALSDFEKHINNKLPFTNENLEKINKNFQFDFNNFETILLKYGTKESNNSTNLTQKKITTPNEQKNLENAEKKLVEVTKRFTQEFLNAVNLTPDNPKETPKKIVDKKENTLPEEEIPPNFPFEPDPVEHTPVSNQNIPKETLDKKEDALPEEEIQPNFLFEPDPVEQPLTPPPSVLQTPDVLPKEITSEREKEGYASNEESSESSFHDDIGSSPQNDMESSPQTSHKSTENEKTPSADPIDDTKNDSPTNVAKAKHSSAQPPKKMNEFEKNQKRIQKAFDDLSDENFLSDNRFKEAKHAHLARNILKIIQRYPELVNTPLADGKTPLDLATELQQKNLIEALVARRAKTGLSIAKQDLQIAFDKLVSQYSPFRVSVHTVFQQEKLVEEIILILQRHPELLNTPLVGPLTGGKLPLHIACQMQNEEFINSIIDLGDVDEAFTAAVLADDSDLASKIYTAIITYTYKNLHEIDFEGIVEAKVKSIQQKITLYNNLTEAIKSKDLNTLIEGIERNPEQLFNDNGKKQLLLHQAAIHDNKQAALYLIMQYGARTGDFSLTLLPDAEGNSFRKLAKERNWNLTDDDEITSILEAQKSVVEKLQKSPLEEETSVDDEFDFSENFTEVVSQIERGLLPLDFTDSEGRSLLHVAVEEEDIPLITYLMGKYSTEKQLNPWLGIYLKSTELLESPMSCAILKGNLNAVCIMMTGGSTKEEYDFQKMDPEIIKLAKKFMQMKDPLYITKQEQIQALSALIWLLTSESLNWYTGTRGSYTTLAFWVSQIASLYFQHFRYKNEINAEQNLIEQEMPLHKAVALSTIPLSALSTGEMLTQASFTPGFFLSSTINTYVNLHKTYSNIKKAYASGLSRPKQALYKAGVGILPTGQSVYYFGNMLSRTLEGLEGMYQSFMKTSPPPQPISIPTDVSEWMNNPADLPTEEQMKNSPEAAEWLMKGLYTMQRKNQTPELNTVAGVHKTFKVASLIAHPDKKGGSPALFELVKISEQLLLEKAQAPYFSLPGAPWWAYPFVQVAKSVGAVLTLNIVSDKLASAYDMDKEMVAMSAMLLAIIQSSVDPIGKAREDYKNVFKESYPNFKEEL